MSNARILCVLVGLVLAACGGHSNVRNLSLQWRDASKQPVASGPVAAAFAQTPFALTVRDVRRDPTVIGRVEEDGWIVRTSDNVVGFVSQHVGDYMERAGARMRENPVANVDIEILELQVVEGGTFQATTQLRVVVRNGGSPDGWQHIYQGKGTRWGRTHNPENYNEALSNALEEATLAIIADPEFGMALTAPPPAAGG